MYNEITVPITTEKGEKMNATTTRFPESFADPMMQSMFEEELAWGLPYASFDAFMTHSVKGACTINDTLELESGDDPFAWGDVEVHKAASAALLTLRNKQHLSDAEFAQLCWLEKSLHEQVCYCFAGADEATVKRHLGRFAHLVNAKQLQLVRCSDEHLEDEKDDTIDEMFPSYMPLIFEDKGGNIVKPRPKSDEADTYFVALDEVFEQLSDEIAEAEYAEETRQLRTRLLKFLKNIS
jgi:hypothetical protein